MIAAGINHLEKRMMEGSCLCGLVAFAVKRRPTTFYRCHCSLCRKQSGVGFNLATLMDAEAFSWLQGEEAIVSWTKSTGYRNDFCSRCGSTVPNPLRGQPYVWIPVGLLDVDDEMTCVGDFCINDARRWDRVRSDNNSGGAVDSVASLVKRLNQ